MSLGGPRGRTTARSRVGLWLGLPRVPVEYRQESLRSSTPISFSISSVAGFEFTGGYGDEVDKPPAEASRVTLRQSFRQRKEVR